MRVLRSLIVCGAIVAASVPSRASAGWLDSFWAWFGGARDKSERHSRHSVPEFDPAAVGSIGVLLGGGAVLLARRRRTR